MDAIFFSRIKKLVKIVIPTWKSEEVLDIALLTVFLVLRTFLSIYIAAVNGKIVKSIIQRDLGMFVRRVTLLSFRLLIWGSLRSRPLS